MTDTTAVIFRKFKNTGDVIALMPLQAASTANAWLCDSYMHVGQHGAADPDIVRPNVTTLATPDEYADLAAEMGRIGYTLDVRKRFPRNAYSVRKEQLKR